MVESLESALKMIDSFVIDDCSCLAKVLLADYAKLAALNDAIKISGDSSKELYVGPDKYKFVNSREVRELVDFVVRNYNLKNQVSDKLLNHGNPRNYV